MNRDVIYPEYLTCRNLRNPVKFMDEKKNYESMRIQFLLAVSAWWSWTAVESYYRGQMPAGFGISPRSAGPERWGLHQEFLPLLVSPRGNFALGFNSVRPDSFALAVACVVDNSSAGKPITEVVWTAGRNNYVEGDAELALLANGSLALQNRRRNAVYWSTEAGGDGVFLLDSGNLQLVEGRSQRIAWQSFEHPTDTLLQGQNFTAAMKLLSNAGDGPYYLQLQEASMALFADFRAGAPQMYWKRVALQEKALILPGKGRIYARLESSGFLAMYQTESALVDVLPLDTFHRGLLARRLKIEADGNLRSYYWRSPRWEVDFEAVQSGCELPNFCGFYGVCSLGDQCACLANFSRNFSVASPDRGCSPPNIPVDFCRGGPGEIVMVEGMDLPFKQFADFMAVGSAAECRDLCVGNCSCSAAVFYNDSGRCYQVPHPLQTLVQVPNKQKVAFVKLVPEPASLAKPSHKALLIVGMAVSAVIMLGMCACIFVIAYGCKKRAAERDLSLQMSEKFVLRRHLPYKDLEDTSFPL